MAVHWTTIDVDHEKVTRVMTALGEACPAQAVERALDSVLFESDVLAGLDLLVLEEPADGVWYDRDGHLDE